MDIPKTLVFHDCWQDTADAARYTDSRLPKQLQNQRIVKHYHSDMSAEYLQQTYEDFSNPDGRCRVLHATAEASTGLDIQGVQVAIQYGACKNLAELIQRVGQAVRDPAMHRLFVVMYEPWVLDAKLETLRLDAEDLDRPHSKTLIRSTTYLREFFDEYLDDPTSSAQQHSTRWCCDRHPGSDFKLAIFFLGEIYTGQLSEEALTATKRKRTQYRAREDRPDLFDALVAWRNEAHIQDPYRAVWPITWICDDDGLDLLSKTHPSQIGSVQDIVDLFQETAEWGIKYGQQVFDVIKQFDRVRVKSAFNSAPLAKRQRELPSVHKP